MAKIERDLKVSLKIGASSCSSYSISHGHNCRNQILRDGRVINNSSSAQSLTWSVSTSCYEHFVLDGETNIYECKYCWHKFETDTQERLRKQLSRHLMYHHPLVDFPSKIGCVLHRSNSLKSRDVVEEQQIEKQCELAVGKLEIRFGFGVNAFRLRWILMNEMGLSYQQSQLYLDKYIKNLKQVIGEPKDAKTVDVLKLLSTKKIKVIHHEAQDEIEQIRHPSYLLISEEVRQLLESFGDYIFVDVLTISPNQNQTICDLQVTSRFWVYNADNSRICVAILLAHNKLHAGFDVLLCQFLGEMAKFPQAFDFYVSSPLLCSGWDPRPIFEDINFQIQSIDSQFLPYQMTVCGDIPNGLKHIRIQRRQHSFIGKFSYRHHLWASNAYVDWNMPASYLEEMRCFSNGRSVYDMIGGLYSWNRKTHKLLKHNHKFSKASDGLMRMLEYAKDPNFKPIIQMILSNEELIRLGLLLSISVYSVLVEEYQKATKTVILDTAKPKTSVSHQLSQLYFCSKKNRIRPRIVVLELNERETKENSAKSQSWQVTWNLESDCWYCECNMLSIIGVPCCHLVKVIQHYSGSLLYYINQRWLTDLDQNYYAILLRCLFAHSIPNLNDI